MCGWKTAIFVEPDESGKKLLCWRKKEGGPWQGPQELVTEDVPIMQVVIQRYGPASFLPVAYMCATQVRDKVRVHAWPDVNPSKGRSFKHEPWIKVLTVPR